MEEEPNIFDGPQPRCCLCRGPLGNPDCPFHGLVAIEILPPDFKHIGVDLAVGDSWSPPPASFTPVTVAAPIVEKLADSNARLKKAAYDVYITGKWICPELAVDVQTRLWTALRDAIGLPPGTATEKGVGA